MQRLTYKSRFGDYGSEVVYKDTMSEICALRDALGRYEDLGYTPEELKAMLNMESAAKGGILYD